MQVSIILPPINGNAVASIVFFLPIYSMSGPPAMPPISALSGISDPIHMPCDIKFGTWYIIHKIPIAF